MSFLVTFQDKFSCRHFNANKKDNNLSNLMIMTFQQHNRHHKHIPWNKNIGKTEKVTEWHKKTVKSKVENYKQKAL